MAIPYTRFVQAARVAAETQAQTARDELTTAAFIGWQYAGVMGGKKAGPFKRYLKQLGLAPQAPKLTREQAHVEAESVKARLQRATQIVDGRSP